MEARKPSEYVFEYEPAQKSKNPALVDIITDAKFINQAVRMAYCGLIGAILRANGREEPLFDEEPEVATTSDLADRSDTIAPMSIEQGIQNASNVWHWAKHVARAEGNEWLFEMTQRELEVQPDGSKKVVTKVAHVVRPFSEWIKDEKAANTDDSQWGLSIQLVIQLGYGDLVLNEVSEDPRLAVSEWLNEIPASRDSLTTSRRERIVTAVADRKWRDLNTAVQTGVARDIEAQLRNWIIIAYSPKAKAHIAAFRASPAYKTEMVKREQDKLQIEEQNDQFLFAMEELKLGRAELKLNRKIREAKQAEFLSKLESRYAELDARLAGVSTH